MSNEKQEKYTLTDEHRAQLAPWRDKWIANAMSTKPMDDEERVISHKATIGIYAAANLPPPRIVFVSSPFCGRFAAGFAAAIHYMKRNGEKFPDFREMGFEDKMKKIMVDSFGAEPIVPPAKKKMLVH